MKICYGRGGWTWYTGSASWYYICGIEYILGFKVINNKLNISPCIPDEWQEYFIQYKYKNSIYNIKVKNIYKENKVKKILLNGELMQERQIIIIDNGKINNIEVVI